MRRIDRLRVGRKWIAAYTGKSVVRGYCRHFGVDLVCAVRELQLLGVKLDPQRVQNMLASHEGNLEARRRRKAQKQARDAPVLDQDEHFFYIAGYTAGGAPYGITWAEADANGLTAEDPEAPPGDDWDHPADLVEWHDWNDEDDLSNRDDWNDRDDLGNRDDWDDLEVPF